MIPKAKVYLVPEAQPRDNDMPSGIISISHFKINIVSTLGVAEGMLTIFFIIISILQMYSIID